jgi:hypothetical protein
LAEENVNDFMCNDVYLVGHEDNEGVWILIQLPWIIPRMAKICFEPKRKEPRIVVLILYL